MDVLFFTVRKSNVSDFNCYCIFLQFKVYFLPQIDKLKLIIYSFLGKSQFNLVESAFVEYFRPNCRMLDRDNVGLIVLLQHQPTNLMSGMDQATNPALKLCVATTHLLYNPKVDSLFIKPS